MDVTARGLLKNWVPHLPRLLQTAILAIARRSPNAEQQQWFVEIIVQCMRPVLQTPSGLLASQKVFNLDPGIWGHMWVAKYTVPCPSLPSSETEPWKEDIGILTIDDTIRFAIDVLATRDDEKACPIPPFDSRGIECEWTSYRAEAQPWSRPPLISQREMYERALSETPAGEDSPVIIFAHGGAFCLMDPANHRPLVSQLAQSTNSRVLDVRYRLSPQAIFPAALMDMFACYLALLSPPPDAFHKAVPGHRIVLAGDSSGANLVTALQILLTTLVQNGRTCIVNPWSPENVITIPSHPTAALSLSSPWLDVTRSLPSTTQNGRYDFIAPPPVMSPSLTSTSPLFPADSIWPADPPRTETYCEAVMCAHALVSPIMAPKEVLADFPSTYISVGWEGMSDEGEVFIRRLYESKRDAKSSLVCEEQDETQRRATDSGYASSNETLWVQTQENEPIITKYDDTAIQNVIIKFDGYTAMPHTFSILPFSEAGKRAKTERANHIKQAVQLAGLPAADLIVSEENKPVMESSATWTSSKTWRQSDVRFSSLGMNTGKTAHCGYEREQPLTDELVHELVDKGRNFRVDLEKRLRQEAAAQKAKLLAENNLGAITSAHTLHRDGYLTRLLWTVTLFVRDRQFVFFNWLLWKMMQLGISL